MSIKKNGRIEEFMIYECKKCGQTEVFIKQVGNQTGLYCLKCSAWIKWLTKAEIKKAYEHIKEQHNDKNVSIRTFIKKNGNTIIRCSECGCQLYNSNTPRPQGQFDLIGAKYCPQCGKELI